MLEQGVPGRDGDAKVAALDYEAHVGEGGAHAVEGGMVVAEEVGAGDGV